ncbi:uncharacterized protein TRAVEDRAFT_133379 [Trametes versicolor FP-101664 SS1]|uniref:uncharacterized protein n=1 Tax=Trametes versicolor (strain FP-101664) TaxID=717944 RepID=UPI0004621A1C|nr:uncharacterized protein TRAVEDRAFT_133379 [Trametes versicolor FP-101664 SS1]EIW53546.1 hypothetical protein TRAVEDRAFT_133379 [Trametes versicolor FP-101664 SS1]
MDDGSISALNDDVLDLIVEAASHLQAIPALSRTCRRIRLRCLPSLCREFSLRSPVPIAARGFVPEALRPYVSILHFNDRCGDIPREEDLRDALERDLRFTTDPLLCAVYSTPFFATALESMPRLHTLSFNLHRLPIHGIPWSVVQMILALPTLRNLTINGHRIAPSLLPQEELVLDRCAPLTSFQHTMSDYRRWRKQDYPDERQALLLVLNRTHATLETLTLVTELSPLDEVFTALEWPNLRELRLRGERKAIGDSSLPFISLFANVPRLRHIELKLAQPKGVDPQLFWPPGHDIVEWPWPNLRHLTLSCPHVDDQIHGALPPTLESLALCYTPHMIHSVWNGRGMRCQWPLVSSSEMLQILRRCRCPRLTSLELEYREDEANTELMQHIGASYPALTSVKLLRYRAVDDAEAGPLVSSRCFIFDSRYRSALTQCPGRPQEPLLRMMGAHPRLQHICLHLDHPDTTASFYYPTGYKYDIAEDITRLESYLALTQSLADSLAGASSPSLETITLWAPHCYFPYSWFWEKFVVIRDETTGVGVRAEAVNPRKRD